MKEKNNKDDLSIIAQNRCKSAGMVLRNLCFRIAKPMLSPCDKVEIASRYLCFRHAIPMLSQSLKNMIFHPDRRLLHKTLYISKLQKHLIFARFSPEILPIFKFSNFRDASVLLFRSDY